jgi:uncharacterized SAM-binding protein YcdF (DUF218 family)
MIERASPSWALKMASSPASGPLTMVTVAPQAEAMQSLLEERGVLAASIIFETRSRNTRENAVFAEQLLAGHGLQRVLLVTSSMHMPRALATFRTAGIDAVAAPTDFTVTYRDHRTVIDFLPDAGALAHTTHAIKEYIGFAYYRWRGWITAERNQYRIYSLFAYLELDKKPASGRQPLPV